MRDEATYVVDTITALRAEVERLTRLLDAFHDGVGVAAENERLKQEMRHLDSCLQERAKEIGQLRAEIERLKAENAAQKAEMQKLYENWVRVLNLPEEPKP